MMKDGSALSHMFNISQGDLNCPTFGKIIKTSELFIQSTKSRVYISYSSRTGVTLGRTHLFEYSANYMAKEVTMLLLFSFPVTWSEKVYKLNKRFVKYEEMSKIE